MRTSPVDLLRFDYIPARLAEELAIDADAAEDAIAHYRRFLALKLKHPGEALVAPALVDAVWHQHILNTRAYVADCEALFGGYMHHDPFPSEAVHGDGWARTKALFLSDFGIDLETQPIAGLRIAGRSA